MNNDYIDRLKAITANVDSNVDGITKQLGALRMETITNFALACKADPDPNYAEEAEGHLLDVCHRMWIAKAVLRGENLDEIRKMLI